MAYIGVSPSNGVRRVHTYTATASQTTFSGTGAEGTSLSYKDSNFVDVYQNGIKLGDADYTSTSGTSIVLAQGASVDDLVVVVVFDVFSVADTVSKADGGTFDGNVTMAGTITVTGNADLNGDLDVDGTTNLDVVDIDGAVDMASTLQVDGAITSSAGATITTADNTAQLSLISTDADANSGPELDLYRNSSSPADADLMGKVTFRGRNDNSQDVNYGQIVARAEDASDGTEDGRVDFRAIIGGTEGTFMKYHVPSGNEVVFNDGSLDIDFRVESNGNANMLFVDGGNDKIYIGRDANDGKFSSKLQIESNDSTAGMSMHRASNDSGPPYLAMSKSRLGNFADDTVVQSGDGLGTIYWSGADGTDRGSGACYIAGNVDGTPGSDDMPGRITFGTTPDGSTTPAERMRIDSSGHVGIGTTSPTAKFEVAGNDPNPLMKFNQFQNADEVLLMMRHDYARTDGQTATMIQFQNNSNVEKGTIKTSLNATQFNTSSDYRLKENVNYTWDATTRLKQLKPARFNWISDDTNTLVDGFLAHEVQSIVPQAVDGNKDDMLVETKYTEDDVETQGDNPSKSIGDPKTYSSTEINPQGIDQSKLVPLLVKTIQELEARITALESK